MLVIAGPLVLLVTARLNVLLVTGASLTMLMMTPTVTGSVLLTRFMSFTVTAPEIK